MKYQAIIVSNEILHSESLKKLRYYFERQDVRSINHNASSAASDHHKKEVVMGCWTGD